MPKISACVIAQNSANSIERCVKSLAFADEVVVVDAGSTDGTIEKCQALGAKVVTSAWKGFAEQRNVGLDHCMGDWVFFLDSDEAASVELGQSLRAIASQPLASHPNCYSIKRTEYFLGKELHYGPGNPSHQWRFFKRAGVRFEGEVHEFPVFEGPVGKLETPIHHWPDLSVDKFLAKLNHYTTLEALDRFSQGQRTSLWHATFTFFSTFLKNGFRYRGLWNGKEGFVLTLLESFSRVVRHLKLWLFWQVHDGKIKMNLGIRLPAPGSAAVPEKTKFEKEAWTAK
jgi:glycosyltransferase involved in cell wall biosynthesis